VTAILVAGVGLGGCGLVKKMAMKSVAGSLARGGESWAADDDPELIRDATPFALKTLESLLEEMPEHRGLLLSACRGFTQYGYAFVQADADTIEIDDYERAEVLRTRALKLYLRGRNYGLRSLELDHPGITDALMRASPDALRKTKAKDLPILFWTAAAWGSAISLGKDRADLVADLPAVRALIDRCLALDETYEQGSIHEVLITLEALPAHMGGSMERARSHFERAVTLSEGKRAGTYVTMAESVSIGTQNRAEFETLIARALAVDPDVAPSFRLANILAQRKAAYLAAHVDDYFLEGPAENGKSNP
jgi:predicted anti-sigma-YlaC factor YlaD